LCKAGSHESQNGGQKSKCFFHDCLFDGEIGFVTEKTIDGLFFSIGEEEQKIRKDPAAQVTDLLKKVFGK
jgi:hypothetical protein